MIGDPPVKIGGLQVIEISAPVINEDCTSIGGEAKLVAGIVTWAVDDGPPLLIRKIADTLYVYVF